jgi:hypothetical protein
MDAKRQLLPGTPYFKLTLLRSLLSNLRAVAVLSQQLNPDTQDIAQQLYRFTVGRGIRTMAGYGGSSD